MKRVTDCDIITLLLKTACPKTQAYEFTGTVPSVTKETAISHLLLLLVTTACLHREMNSNLVGLPAQRDEQ